MMMLGILLFIHCHDLKSVAAAFISAIIIPRPQCPYVGNILLFFHCLRGLGCLVENDIGVPMMIEKRLPVRFANHPTVCDSRVGSPNPAFHCKNML